MPHSNQRALAQRSCDVEALRIFGDRLEAG
jgi:hypothetical protein